MTSSCRRCRPVKIVFSVGSFYGVHHGSCRQYIIHGGSQWRPTWCRHSKFTALDCRGLEPGTARACAKAKRPPAALPWNARFTVIVPSPYNRLHGNERVRCGWFIGFDRIRILCPPLALSCAGAPSFGSRPN
jgi:hypothetical protein